MPGSIEEIKRRLRSVTSIQKITRAMKLIATAKLQKTRANLQSAQDFYLSVYRIASEVISNLSPLELKRITTIDNDRTLFIVINSDLGFCGSYNNEINKKLMSVYKPDRDAIIAIGSKMEKFCKWKKLNMVEKYVDLGINIDFELAKNIATVAISLRNINKFKNLKIIYTHYINSISFQPIVLSIWPVDKDLLNSIKLTAKNLVVSENKSFLFDKVAKDSSFVVEYEPSITGVFDTLVPLFTSAIVYGCLLESSVSEQASRLSVMESATDNAKELENDLNLQKNRLRQSSITQEISEIIASAEFSGGNK